MDERGAAVLFHCNMSMLSADVSLTFLIAMTVHYFPMHPLVSTLVTKQNNIV